MNDIGVYGRTKTGLIVKYVNYELEDGTMAPYKLLVKNKVITRERIYDEIVKYAENIIELLEIGDIVRLYIEEDNESFTIEMLEDFYEDWMEDLRKRKNKIIIYSNKRTNAKY